MRYLHQGSFLFPKLEQNNEQMFLTTANICSILCFITKYKKTYTNHANGVGAPLKWISLLINTQIQCRYGKDLNSRIAIEIILHNLLLVVKLFQAFL